MAPFRRLAVKAAVLVPRSSEQSGQPNNRVIKQRRNHHTAMDWVRKKETIIQLYATENKQANDVIETLRSEFAFNTSRRQLFNKLKEWGIQKNQKRDGEHLKEVAENFEGESGAVGPGSIAFRIANPSAEPALPDISPSYLPDDREMFDKMNAQGWPTSRGLLMASPVQPSQTFHSWVGASPSNQFLQLSEIPLEALDLRTPRLLSDDDAGPPFLLPAFSPRVTELVETSTAMDIRRRSSTPVAFELHHHSPSENGDIFPASPHVIQETATPIGGEQAPRTPQSYPSLENGICSVISKFLDGNERIISYSNGLQLKEDLKSLLDSVQEGLSQTPCAQHNFSDELSLVNDLISSAPTISIDANGSFRFPHYLLPKGRNIWSWKTRTTALVGTTILDVSTRFSKKYPSYGRNDARVLGNDRMYNCLKIGFKPQGSAFALQIEVNQCPQVNSSFASIPRLSIKNIAPSHSLGFRVAKSGSVQDLMNLFASGQANIRDHDENGWSLLHHSLGNPQMCQFLVQSGLDVDEITSSPEDGPKGTRTPLHLSYFSRKCLETTRILLVGGADPTINVYSSLSVTAHIANTVILKDFTLLRDIFNLCTHFGVSNVRNCAGRTILLSTFQLDQPILRPDDQYFFDPAKKIKFLLSRGSRIEERDPYGSNCLAVFFRSDLRPPSRQNWLGALIYTVRQGADVYSADIYGVTVSQIAYAKRFCQDVEQDFGSYRGDLWDSVLHACGYNILEFRTAYPRTARYTELYTRRDFESLWKDREHLCPYWDDNEWPTDLAPYQRAPDPSIEQKHLCCCDFGAVRWLDVYNNDRSCCYNGDYSGSDGSNSDSQTDSDIEYDADDENDEWEIGEGESGGEAAVITLPGIQNLLAIFDDYETGNRPEDVEMRSPFEEPDGVFHPTVLHTHDSWE
ncbi:hypothetical protein F4803DRAFT_165257 [Xylaria telfairii]|nr:hypothetical protein F4803DRAFT_165257 [Xylaria telfairii]